MARDDKEGSVANLNSSPGDEAAFLAPPSASFDYHINNGVVFLPGPYVIMRGSPGDGMSNTINVGVSSLVR